MWFENCWSPINMKIRIFFPLQMSRNFAFSYYLTHVQKCAIQTLARDITGSRSKLSCFIIAIELLQACYYAVMKGVFSCSFQLANLGEIPYVISLWHRFWGKEFTEGLKYVCETFFHWKKRRKCILVQLNLNLILQHLMGTNHLKYNFSHNLLFGEQYRLSLCWLLRIGFGCVWVYGKSNVSAADVLLVPCWTLWDWGCRIMGHTWTGFQPGVRLSGSAAWLLLFSSLLHVETNCACESKYVNQCGIMLSVWDWGLT